MQDRFKFRAWDIEEDRYASDDDICYDTGGTWDSVYDLLKVANQFYVYEQCTGLKDKNGKLIYEGDILKSAYTEKTYIVGREKHYACWSYRYKNVGTTLSEGDIVNYGLEVIGNIHENPELLEEDK